MRAEDYHHKIAAIYPDAQGAGVAVVDTTRWQRRYRLCLNSLGEHTQRGQLDRRLPPAAWLDRRFRFTGWFTEQVGMDSNCGAHR